MLRQNRIIFSDDGSLNDLSINQSNYLTGADPLAIVAAEDQLFLGSDIPFNHRYFVLSTPNENDSIVSVSIWDGREFTTAVDVIDETSLSGASFGKSGVISWVPNRFKHWHREPTSSDIPGLQATTIYNMFWARLTFSGNFSANSSIKYIGHKFCEAADLYVEYPDLDNSTLLTAFKTGKTSWDDQIFIASEYVIAGLREMGVIWSRNQILDWQLFKSACVHKTAEIIFTAMGDDYKDNKNDARAAFKAAMKVKFFSVDLNEDGVLSHREKKHSQIYLSR